MANMFAHSSIKQTWIEYFYYSRTSQDNLNSKPLLEHSAPSVRALKIFDITQVATTKTLQFRHVVLGPG
jgi:hypothetical protein